MFRHRKTKQLSLNFLQYILSVIPHSTYVSISQLVHVPLGIYRAVLQYVKHMGMLSLCNFALDSAYTNWISTYFQVHMGGQN